MQAVGLLHLITCTGLRHLPSGCRHQVVDEGEGQGAMVVGCKEGETMRLSASLAAAAPACGGEAKSSNSGPAWVAGVVGKGQAIVAKVGVSFSFSLGLGLSFPLVQSADVLVGCSATRVSLVETIA